MSSTTVSISGQGLNSPHLCRVDLSRGEAGTGLQIFLEDQSVPWWANAFPGEVSAQRTTILHHQGQNLRGMEHLSVALAAWPRADAVVRIFGGDIPILDGSAQPWVNALTQILGKSPGFALQKCNLEYEEHWPSGYIKAKPYHKLCINLSLGMWKGGAPMVCEINPGDFIPEIFLARTFITEKEWEGALKSGLLQGAQEDCGILLKAEKDHWGLAVGGAFRHPDEPLWHKCADLLGDLSFLGRQFPRLHIEIHNGGHAIHHKLMQRIRNVIT
ncbi:MAG: UDP-3-O-acyl-N-acetylglucosamine deacetylase [Fibrobacter sp.]|nr:UDP-3-O-acyl-N-acetylglucosamine deacetylase [Fibrobacter sp.]